MVFTHLDIPARIIKGLLYLMFGSYHYDVPLIVNYLGSVVLKVDCINFVMKILKMRTVTIWELTMEIQLSNNKCCFVGHIYIYD
jgi:hypothetical protein